MGIVIDTEYLYYIMYSIDLRGKMKAAQITEYGDQNAMSISEEAQKPVPKDNEVLVEVYASGVNPFDWKVRAGYMKNFIPLELPATLGGDVVGVVAEVGNSVKGFEVGQEVLGLANAAGGHGSFAEFTSVKAEQLIAKPDSLNPIEAAALPLAGISAYQALVDHIQLKSGQTILIHGGAGGIGSFAIQIAKHLGARVATTASSNDLDYVKRLGADDVIDYTNDDFVKRVHDVDAVYDTVGGDTNIKSYQVLKDGGTLVSMVEAEDAQLSQDKNITYIQQSSKVTQQRLTAVADLVVAGDLKINIEKIFPFEQAPEALEYLKVQHPRGKVVIKVK